MFAIKAVIIKSKGKEQRPKQTKTKQVTRVVHIIMWDAWAQSPSSGCLLLVFSAVSSAVFLGTFVFPVLERNSLMGVLPVDFQWTSYGLPFEKTRFLFSRSCLWSFSFPISFRKHTQPESTWSPVMFVVSSDSLVVIRLSEDDITVSFVEAPASHANDVCLSHGRVLCSVILVLPCLV